MRNYIKGVRVLEQGVLKNGMLCLLVAISLSIAGKLARADDPPPSQKLFTTHCASCHGADRFGSIGPALLPENLERLRKTEAVKTIAEGRIATQMPGFANKLSKEEIQSLVDLIYTPPEKPPIWGVNEIQTSRIEYFQPDSLPNKPVFKADPMNLFVVVETGDHHATILDGDRFEPILRFKTRFALHGGPKFSQDGRYVFFASRDGWVSKFDIYNLKMTAEIRAGLNTRNLAVSSDGRYVMVGNYLPHTLVLLDARDLKLIKIIPVQDDNGKSSRVSAVYDAAPRKSFVAALKDFKELWEISYDDKAPPIYSGMVHDYKMGEAIALPGKLNPRRIVLEDYLDDFFFDQSYDNVMGASRDGGKGQVVNLNIRRKIAELDLPGLPHLGSGITWEYQGHPVMATPNLKQGDVSVIDMKTWKTIKRIETLGPGFFMRSHENTPYAWVDNFMSPAHRDTLQIIDKNTLQIVKTLQPAPGKTTAHVEFTQDGKYALISVWEKDGALIIMDAATFKEIKRLPMNKPSGKYNVFNKTSRSAGTSH